MKRFLAVCALSTCFLSIGCAPKEAGVVVDKDEAAQYNVPEGAMEAEMEAAAAAAAANAGK